MNINKTTIAVDAMGGDNSPFKVLKGVELFCSQKPDVNFYLFGSQPLIEENIKIYNIKISNFEIVNTINNISDDDTPNTILRNRKDSSISQGLHFVKNSPINSGFVSAGNTAALMILSRLILGMIKGIDRPAICSVIPNNIDYSIMLDLGANSSVVAKNLLQFALMGFCYHSILKPNTNPKIGIINIGTEDNKGHEFLKEASDLINDSFLSEYFIGFLEPNKITSGLGDIMVADGYTGNIILKTAEGMSEFITNNLKKVFEKSIKNKISYSILKNDLNKFKDKINPEKYNGASLVGVNGVSIKSHGGATPYAFSCALDKCYNFINNDINKKISENFENL